MKSMMEHAVTIRKAMVQTEALSSKVASGDAQSLNQSCRWVSTKDEHADKIISTTAEYFLAQRVVVRPCPSLASVCVAISSSRATGAPWLYSHRLRCTCSPRLAGQARRQSGVLCLPGAAREASRSDEGRDEDKADCGPGCCRQARRCAPHSVSHVRRSLRAQRKPRTALCRWSAPFCKQLKMRASGCMSMLYTTTKETVDSIIIFPHSLTPVWTRHNILMCIDSVNTTQCIDRADATAVGTNCARLSDVGTRPSLVPGDKKIVSGKVTARSTRGVHLTVC